MTPWSGCPISKKKWRDKKACPADCRAGFSTIESIKNHSSNSKSALLKNSTLFCTNCKNSFFRLGFIFSSKEFSSSQRDTSTTDRSFLSKESTLTSKAFAIATTVCKLGISVALSILPMKSSDTPALSANIAIFHPRSIRFFRMAAPSNA